MEVVLSDPSGYEAVFYPLEGMTLASYKKHGIEVIDPATRAGFDERRGGLGPLIGPHFHMRSPSRIPHLPDESKFPLIAAAKEKGRQDPFSHGIARYVAWKYENTSNSLKGTLSGKDLWEGVPLAILEGQNFTYTFEANLSEKGLQIDLSIVSDTDSLVGLHYYYRLPQKKGLVKAHVQNRTLINSKTVAIPENWGYQDHLLEFELDKPADFTFYSHPDPLQNNIELITNEYKLSVQSNSLNQETCWQLYHPDEASFVCIEPLSAASPRNPILSASFMKIILKIDVPKT